MDGKREILQQYFGYTQFREGQEMLIDAQMAGRDVFGIMPTGGGKSLCYQIPALLLDGITLVVSPLISLMKDQVMALKKAGIPAAYINSTLSMEQLSRVYRNLVAGKYKIVYVAPERLLTEHFLSAVRKVAISLVAVDEAHCISQWGQDFRPSYLKITEFLATLEYRPVVSAFTATATPAVQDDIQRALALRDPLRIVAGFDRPNLSFEVMRPKKKLPAVESLVDSRADKSGIIYCATRKNVETVCEALREKGVSATRYHAGLDADERRTNQEDFLYDRSRVMVATNAFGMGIDKSNVSYVIHYNMPQSVEAYYQEAGRAGRDGAAAECILLYAPADIQTAKFLITHPMEKEERSAEEQRRAIEQDLLRLKEMTDYCSTTDCLRGYILSYFGEAHAPSCGNCGNCRSVLTETEMTTQAKMILSCVKRMRDHVGYSLGITAVIRTLWGSRDKRLLELGLDRISTYGIMHSTTRPLLREMIEELERQGYLRTDPVHRGVMLTERARDVLFEGEQVTMHTRRASAVREQAPSTGAAPADADLLAVLKELRMTIAKEEKVPAYVVFSNATLEDMAEKAPTTPAAFLNVSGVGRYKSAHYGTAFLAAIRQYKENL